MDIIKFNPSIGDCHSFFQNGIVFISCCFVFKHWTKTNRPSGRKVSSGMLVLQYKFTWELFEKKNTFFPNFYEFSSILDNERNFFGLLLETFREGLSKMLFTWPWLLFVLKHFFPKNELFHLYWTKSKNIWLIVDGVVKTAFYLCRGTFWVKQCFEKFSLFLSFSDSERKHFFPIVRKILG